MESDQMESRRAERESQPRLFGAPFQFYTYYSPPRWVDFDSDVSADEDFNKLLNDLPEDDILPYMYPWADDCDWMELADNLWVDFDSDVSADEDFNKLLNDLRAVRRAQSIGFGVFLLGGTDYSPPRRGDFSLSEKKRIVSAVENWLNSLDDHVLFTRRAVRRAQLVMERWVEFGSDVSAVEDFHKLVNDLMAVRRAQSSGFGVFLLGGTDYSPPRRGDFSLSEKKRIVSAVENWINCLDDQMAEEMAQLCLKIWGLFGSDVSADEDFNKLLKNMMAEEMALLRLKRWGDFDSDVSAVEVLKKISDDLMATRSTESNYTDVYMRSDPTIPIRCHSLLMSDVSSSEKKHDVTYVEEWIRSLNDQLDDFIGPDIDPVGDHDDLMRMSMRSTESNDSGVSLQSDGSKVEVIDFKDRVSPSMAMGRPESIHSDVSLKSDWSKAEPFDFKDKVSPRGIITVTVTLAVAGLFISARCVR